jgi:hypothetical protein
MTTPTTAWREASIAIKDELIVEASEEALPDDTLFYEQDALAAELSDEAVEDAFYDNEEGKEEVAERFKPDWPARAQVQQELDQARARLELETAALARKVRAVARADYEKTVLNFKEAHELARSGFLDFNNVKESYYLKLEGIPNGLIATEKDFKKKWDEFQSEQTALEGTLATRRHPGTPPLAVSV